MGRPSPSQGLAPPAKRKELRAKEARRIVNHVVPGILKRNEKARRGVEGSVVIMDPGKVVPGLNEEKQSLEGEKELGYMKRKGQGRRKVKGGGEVEDEVLREGKGKGKGRRRKDSVDERFDNLSIRATAPEMPSRKQDIRIRIVVTDTLTAAHMLTFPAKYNQESSHPKRKLNSNKKQPNTLILNMASPLRPGGGVLTGATSQEEFLCARTTLLPSLHESFYRLPELGGVYTHDVLVFRNHLPLNDTHGELGAGERFWVDVVSAGMLRFPDLEGGDEEGKGKRLSKKDRRIVEAKMRAVMRIAVMKGARKIVLGAWGAGAYGNPVLDVAGAWRCVLLPSATTEPRRNGKGVVEAETWEGVEEIVFAITNQAMAEEFGRAFGADIVVEAGPGEVVDEEDGEDEAVSELRGKIEEMEGQIPKVWNAELKDKLVEMVEKLRQQLKEREQTLEDDGRSDGDNESFALSDDRRVRISEDGIEDVEEDDEDTEESGNGDLTDEERSA